MSSFKNTSVNLSIYILIYIYIYNNINSSLSKSFGPFNFQMYRTQMLNSHIKLDGLIFLTKTQP